MRKYLDAIISHETKYMISNIIGILAAILFTVLFSIKVKKLSNSKLEA